MEACLRFSSPAERLRLERFRQDCKQLYQTPRMPLKVGAWRIICQTSRGENNQYPVHFEFVVCILCKSQTGQGFKLESLWFTMRHIYLSFVRLSNSFLATRRTQTHTHTHIPSCKITTHTHLPLTEIYTWHILTPGYQSKCITMNIPGSCALEFTGTPVGLEMWIFVHRY